MSCWDKEQLENMLEDVVNELDLSEAMIEKHGPMGTAPAELVKLILEQKNREIDLLKRKFVPIVLQGEPETQEEALKAWNTRPIESALLEALKQADMFITNGIELGYIRLPDPDTNDSALKTPGIVKKAIAEVLQGDTP